MNTEWPALAGVCDFRFQVKLLVEFF